MTDNIDANNNTGYLFNFTVEGGTSSDFDGLLDGNGYAITNVSHPILNGLYGTIRNIAFTNVTDTNIGETHALIMRAAAGGEIYNVYIEATLSENTTAWGILTDDITPYWTTGYVIVKATVVRDVVMNISYTGDTKIGAVAGSSWFGGNTALTERVLVITDSENVEIMRTEGFTVAGSSGTVQNCEVYSLTEYKGLAEKPEWIAQLYEKGFSDDENGIPVLPEKQVQA